MVRASVFEGRVMGRIEGHVCRSHEWRVITKAVLFGEVVKVHVVWFSVPVLAHWEEDMQYRLMRPTGDSTKLCDL